MRSVHVTEALSAYLDGALSDAERGQIERHLDTCDECRGHLAALREVVTLVRTAEPVNAPEGFRARVRAKVEQIAAQGRSRRLWPPLPLSWRTISAAAAVLVIGIFAVNLLRTQGPQAIVGLEKEAVEGPAVDRSAPNARGPERVQRATDVPGPLTARRIIRTATMEVEVDRVEEAAERLLRIAEAAGGFIAGSSYAESGGVPRASFVLRVPVPRFASVMAEIEEIGRVSLRSIQGQDVSEEFVDLQARVRNLERHEGRLLTFMDRATKVSELLAIEQELARVRGEIEGLTGRIRFLSNQADLATVEVGVRQKAKRTSGILWDFGATVARMQAAFVATVRQVLSAVERLAVLASALVPVLILAAAVWLLVRRWMVARA